MRKPSASFVLLAGTILTLTSLYLLVGDSTWWGECVTVWPSFGWCLLLLPRAGLLAWRRHWLELGLSDGLMGVFVGLTTEWKSLFRRVGPDEAAQFEEARSRADGTALRVVSWNVAGGSPLADLEPLAPDLAFFQEGGFGKVTLGGLWTGYQYLAGLDPATLSRYPAVTLPTRKVGPWVEPQLLRVAPPGGATLLLANVRLVLPTLVVSAANLEGPRGLIRASEDRRDQYTRLAELLSETMQRERIRLAILCGDFNTPGGARSLEPLGALLQDVWPSSGVGWGATMTADLPVSRIDQCWVTPPIRPVRAWVRKGQSDHRMLVVDLLLPRS